ncbi:MAG: nucleotidyl transferase AbiEii/AbiGii toxin family protein [Ignavibacteria bacterium]|nr:nucleotidyl transferase AbiEii/AbiGii toxin family protein [Ignavibacteria bacterium]
MLHKEILTKEQVELLDLVKTFSKNFYLVGGTSIALQLGHRRSIDFDLFTDKALRPKLLLEKIHKDKVKIQKVFVRTDTELTIIVNFVKLTFYNFPFNIPPSIKFENYLTMPSLLDLAAMKAFALGGRGKWKDYVDLYCLLSEHFSLEQVGKRAEELFGESFNERLFREQLIFFKDIDYTEDVVWMQKSFLQEEIKSGLVSIATTFNL